MNSKGRDGRGKQMETCGSNYRMLGGGVGRCSREAGHKGYHALREFPVTVPDSNQDSRMGSYVVGIGSTVTMVNRNRTLKELEEDIKYARDMGATDDAIVTRTGSSSTYIAEVIWSDDK